MKTLFLHLCVVAACLHGALASSCNIFGETLNANILSSTLYNPNDFTAQTCVWKLRSQIYGYAVQISFDYLIVGYTSSCTSNYIAIHDGSSSSSVQLGRVCGSVKPPIIRSRGTYLYLKLIRTGHVSFKITYKAVKLVSSTTQCSPFNSFYNNNNLRFSASYGYIRSPQYPSNYPSSIQCTWIITVPYGKKAELSFTSVSTEGGICSSNDYVQVRDGSSSSRSLGLFCSKPSTIRASGRTLWVRFRSDADSRTGKGFQAQYTTQKSTSLSSTSSSLSAGVIVGIIFGVGALIAFIAIIACCVKSGNRGGVVVGSAPATRTTVTMTNRIPVAAGPKQPAYPPQHPGYYSTPSQNPGYNPPSQQVHYPPPPQPIGYPPAAMQYQMGLPGAYPPTQPGLQSAQFPAGQPVGYPPSGHLPQTAPIPNAAPPPYPGTLQDQPTSGT